MYNKFLRIIKGRNSVSISKNSLENTHGEGTKNQRKSNLKVLIISIGTWAENSCISFRL
jgi:hypothetical protein